MDTIHECRHQRITYDAAKRELRMYRRFGGVLRHVGGGDNVTPEQAAGWADGMGDAWNNFNHECEV